MSMDTLKVELGERAWDAMVDENESSGWAPKYDTIVIRAYEAQHIRRYNVQKQKVLRSDRQPKSFPMAEEWPLL